MSRSIITKFYWLLPFFLVLLQVVYTLNSTTQIRYEETDQLRNNYWFAHHLIIQAGYTNFGGYGTVDIVNWLFGFHLWNYKYLKLFIALFSLFSAAILLRRYLGVKWATVVLLIFGLSPTMLFYNTLATVYAVDMQYFPILLLLVLTTFKNSFLELGKYAVLWMLMMWGWLSYPTMAFLVLPIGIFFIQTQGKTKKFRWLSIAVALVAFVIPVISCVLWVHNRDQLFDSRGNGIFLSGGAPEIRNSLGDTFYQAFAGLGKNLFIKATAYEFEVNQVEFSGIIPFFALIFIVMTPLLCFNKAKGARLTIFLCFVVIFLNFILSSIAIFSGGGFRRFTPLLLGFYCLLGINIYLVYSKRIFATSLPKWLVSVSIGIILIHHIVVYPINFSHIKDPSHFREFSYFNLYESPQAALDQTVSDTSFAPDIV